MICVDLLKVGMAQPDKVLFEDVSVTVSTGDRMALVGINGSGKTTLLNILASALDPDEGEVRFGRDVRIAHLDQDPRLPPGTVRSFLGDDWEVEAVATSLGIQPLLDRPTDELSGGQAKRAALASTLVGEYDLIVLDEPTNHLDLEAIEWLEQRLERTNAALLLVTHDRYLMDRLTTARGDGRILELDQGRAHLHRAAAGESAYATYLDGRAARHEQEAATESTRRILARRELEWLRRGAKARSSKPKARLRSAHDIMSGGPADTGPRGDDLLLDMGTNRLGNQVVELVGVGQSYGERRVFSDIDLMIEPGARLGIVGPNGSGKSTLLDIIAGRTRPAAGTVKVGATVVTGYSDQRTTDLDPDAVVRNLVAGPHRQPDHEDRALLERFWFDTTAQFAPVRMLSGGERRRLQLVLTLAAAPNLLVLDEPTNDLDLDTLRALEVFLDDWPGALVVASHDRVFLDRTVDHVLAIDNDGSVRRVPGGVAGWLAQRSSPAPAAPAKQSTKSAKPAKPAKPATPRPGRELRQVEQRMEKTQRRVDRLTAELESTVDRDQLAELGVELADAQSELDRLETTWLELA